MYVLCVTVDYGQEYVVMIDLVCKMYLRVTKSVTVNLVGM